MRGLASFALAVATLTVPLAVADGYNEHRFFDFIEGDQPVFGRHDLHEIVYASDGESLHVAAWLNQSGVPYNPARYEFFLTFVADPDGFGHDVICDTSWGSSDPDAECVFRRQIDREEVAAGIHYVEYETTPVEGTLDVHQGRVAASVPYSVLHATSGAVLTNLGARSNVCVPASSPVMNSPYCPLFVDEAYDWEVHYTIA